ncbi:hypothetical protein D7Y27_11090 [Corallococcus sp. AB004]|uniref:hypothetical protein n=1 Tax=Corallococcus TaxID=83461 RepID=UPI000EA34248|nr:MULTISPECIES: hypothetical protein [Corallococcus]RKI45233.1 hypothetical protein D7Y27_11090 [Corallococcus sp. AB004]NPC68720.1 hypothetical protein [Corallococcus exiguus]NPD26390.1 hypothetical protein [Corallococcus exiguus]NRD44035.1 hypothetical protein [Corallococcus exiguus]RKI01403.1 hypothetical protein D7Y04_12705 [Corallococcus sp. AB038B]
MKLKMALAAVAACLGFAAGFTNTQAEAAGPCPYCIDMRARCMRNATTPAQEEACYVQFDKCRIDWCERH